MALFALTKAFDQDHSVSIEQGHRWLNNPAKISRSLVETEWNVICRKVARHEPSRLVRGLQTTASRLHPAIRLPGVEVEFPPDYVDYESRPYHMGWILHAWPTNHTLEPLKQ